MDAATAWERTIQVARRAEAACFGLLWLYDPGDRAGRPAARFADNRCLDTLMPDRLAWDQAESGVHHG